MDPGTGHTTENAVVPLTALVLVTALDAAVFVPVPVTHEIATVAPANRNNRIPSTKQVAMTLYPTTMPRENSKESHAWDSRNAFLQDCSQGVVAVTTFVTNVQGQDLTTTTTLQSYWVPVVLLRLPWGHWHTVANASLHSKPHVLLDQHRPSFVYGGSFESAGKVKMTYCNLGWLVGSLVGWIRTGPRSEPVQY